MPMTPQELDELLQQQANEGLGVFMLVMDNEAHYAEQTFSEPKLYRSRAIAIADGEQRIRDTAHLGVYHPRWMSYTVEYLPINFTNY